MKSPLPQYAALRKAIQGALGPNRNPILIGVDGALGHAKSSTASWLAWQFGMPSIHLDLYIVPNTDPLQFMTEELKRLVRRRLQKKKPVIVEGMLLLDALDAIRRKPDFLLFMDGEATGQKTASILTDYWARQRPRERANFVISGHDDLLL
jgi:uridine kinase